jgi:hypothetical protein
MRMPWGRKDNEQDNRLPEGATPTGIEDTEPGDGDPEAYEFDLDENSGLTPEQLAWIDSDGPVPPLPK